MNEFFCKLLLFIALFAIANTAVIATEMDEERKFERLSNELQLTVEQKAKLEAIFNEKHEKIRTIREETQDKIEDLLSDEQMEKWDQLKKHRFDKSRSE